MLKKSYQTRMFFFLHELNALLCALVRTGARSLEE